MRATRVRFQDSPQGDNPGQQLYHARAEQLRHWDRLLLDRRQVAITGNNNIWHIGKVFKSLPPVWRSGSGKFCIRPPDHYMIRIRPYGAELMVPTFSTGIWHLSWHLGSKLRLLFVVFTQGHFGLGCCRGTCVCLRVRPSLCHQFRLRDNSSLGLPNLDQRRKTPWLRSLYIFVGWLTLAFRVIFNLKSKFTPFWVFPRNNLQPIPARITRFGPEMQNTLVKIPIVFRVDWTWHIKFNPISKSCLFVPLLRLWNIFETCQNGVCWTFPDLTWLRTYADSLMYADRFGPWTVKQCNLVRLSGSSQPSTPRLALSFTSNLQSLKNSKQRSIAFISVDFQQGISME